MPRPLPVSVGLLGRRSVVGAAVVLGVALLFILVLPLINHAVRGPNDFRPGEPYVVGGNVQITPAPGWQLDSTSELFTTLAKSGAVLVITGASPADATAVELLQPTIDGLNGDTTNTWVVGEPQTFVTDAGDHGASVTGHSTDTAQETWVIISGDMSATLVADSPDSVWATVSPELDAMAASVVILTEETP